MAHRKEHLPQKRCEGCGKLFSWRKKWARDWEQVRYCSERCRRNKPLSSKAANNAPDTRRS
ncbi:MAG: DUF2256 domain-containing protein [Pirellula sp.]